MFDSPSGERAVAQLRTRYARLNEHKISVVDSSECQCGEDESVSHYLLCCPLYEKKRTNEEKFIPKFIPKLRNYKPGHEHMTGREKRR